MLKVSVKQVEPEYDSQEESGDSFIFKGVLDAFAR
jgi:hypothetical protein